MAKTNRQLQERRNKLMNAFVAVLLVIVLLAAAYFFVVQPRQRAEELARLDQEILSKSIEVQKSAKECGAYEGKDYGYTCKLDRLSWKHCANGQETEREFDCAALSKEGTEWFCNAIVQVPASQEVRPACDVKAAKAGSPTPTITSTPAAGSPTPTASTPSPTPSGGVVRTGAPFCGDGLCDANEDCASCVLDCSCPSGSTCQQSAGLCVNPAN